MFCFQYERCQFCGLKTGTDVTCTQKAKKLSESHTHTLNASIHKCADECEQELLSVPMCQRYNRLVTCPQNTPPHPVSSGVSWTCFFCFLPALCRQTQVCGMTVMFCTPTIQPNHHNLQFAFILKIKTETNPPKDNVPDKNMIIFAV